MLLGMQLMMLVMGVVMAAAELPSGVTGPARTSCNAKFSAPCSRVNSEWLAIDTAKRLTTRLTTSSLSVTVDTNGTTTTSATSSSNEDDLECSKVS